MSLNTIQNPANMSSVFHTIPTMYILQCCKILAYFFSLSRGDTNHSSLILECERPQKENKNAKTRKYTLWFPKPLQTWCQNKKRERKNKVWTRIEHGSLTPQASMLPPRYYRRHDRACFNNVYQVIFSKLEYKIMYNKETVECRHLVSK